MRMRMRAALRDERGFTMQLAIGVMFVVMLASAATIAAAGGDIRLSRFDQDDKQAYAAAEAGLNDYLARLNRDSNYWASCADVASPVTQPIKNNAGTAINGARKWRDVPGSNSEYSIELVPAGFTNASAPKCDPAKPIESMIEDGNLRIRSTGRVKGTDRYRTVVGTFRRKGFLDYLYFTDLENLDLAYSSRGYLPPSLITRTTNAAGAPTGADDLKTWAAQACDRHLSGSQTESRRGRAQYPIWRGQYFDGTRWQPANSSFTVNTKGDFNGTFNENYKLCDEIQFVSADRINGPFHSNDDIFTCGTPVFGRVGPPRQDVVEISGTQIRKQGSTRCNNAGSALFYDSSTAGTARPKLNASELDLPPTNDSLADVAAPAYRFNGRVIINLKGDTMDVTNSAGTTSTMPLPANGVIHVASGACPGYDPSNANGAPLTCGDAYVQGSYNKDLTISAANDVIVYGNLKRSTGNTSALLGLIPKGFARIHHPSCDSDAPKNISIDAAILTLTGSFTVDNYWCGGPLGTLTVNGAIAQKHRGTVGTGNDGGILTGYAKNYTYDPALKFRSPPYFLDPVQASWRLLRQTEQSPATKP